MDDWGIDDGYWAVDGSWHGTPPEVRDALRAAMGEPEPGRPLWVVRRGEGHQLHSRCVVVLEDGTELDGSDRLPPDLPLGYHDLVPDDGGPVTRLIVAPHRATPPPDRVAALAVQLYAARSRDSWGIGDLGDLARIARWGAGLGVGGLLVSPLHAPLPTAEPESSPYFASSRCWRNPLHLRVEHVAGYDPADRELAALAEDGRSLGADPHIDRAAVWLLKRAALRRIWVQARPAGRELARYRAEHGDALTTYATFCALAEHFDAGWTAWPDAYRHPAAPAVTRFAVDHADDVAFHAWLQLVCEQQHAAVAAVAGVGLIHDLAVGAAPDGADAWIWQDILAPGVRVGAPPDEFNQAGQDWGLPPLVPWRLRAAGYEPLAHLFRSSFRQAAGLRVDHVMGLFRLWWVPEGAGPAAGGYVRYPGHELLDVLVLESARAGAFVVGEDLGTVEEEVRTALADRGALSYRVAWFEEGPPPTWPHPTLASITTHDLPTVAGVWSGHDHQAAEFHDRLARLVGDPWPGSAAEAATRSYAAVGAAPSAVVSATLEDLAQVEDRPNRPGTVDDENWSEALPLPLEELEAHPPALDVIASLTQRGG